jgi:hypothetical protein
MYHTKPNLPSIIAYTLAIAAFTYIFIPPLCLFLSGIESGMNYIDRNYPYAQPRKPLHDNPILIYTHMYFNTFALGLHLCLLRFHPPRVSKIVHRRIAWTYTVSVTIGTTASIFYASNQPYGNDGGKSGTFAFGIMALATFSTLITALYYIYIRGDPILHREWALRNFAILFGNGVIFRVLANTYLVYMPRWGADFYASWCQMIYLAWMLPLFVAEQCIARERSRQLEGVLAGKTSPGKG